jgi:hypothetical protein
MENHALRVFPAPALLSEANGGKSGGMNETEKGNRMHGPPRFPTARMTRATPSE